MSEGDREKICDSTTRSHSLDLAEFAATTAPSGNVDYIGVGVEQRVGWFVMGENMLCVGAGRARR